MARIYALPTMPKVVLDLVDLVYKIRDYSELVQTRPTSGHGPDNVMLREQFDALRTIQVEWFTETQMGIRNIRGARNDNPIWDIDEILPPEPDPVDFYYADPGSFYRTKNPNPRPDDQPPGWDPKAHSVVPPDKLLSSPPAMKLFAVKPIPIWPPKPKPPFPPFPPFPPAPPPVYWRPSAEEAYTYAYSDYYLVDYYVADMQIADIDFQYWGFYLAEMLKNYYVVGSYWLIQKDVSDFLLPYNPRLTTILC